MAGSSDHLQKYRWQKGVSGNPRGRPTNISFETSVRNWFVKKNPDSAGELSNQDSVVQALGEKMLKGDIGACRLVFERLWPIPQRQEFDVKVAAHELAQVLEVVTIELSLDDRSKLLDRLRTYIEGQPNDLT